VPFFLQSSLRGGASYRNEQGVAALYLDGNGAYADVPSINLFRFPAFSITCGVKVLEPANTTGYIYADWSYPHQFSVWISGENKAVGFQLRNELGEELLAAQTS